MSADLHSDIMRGPLVQMGYVDRYLVHDLVRVFGVYRGEGSINSLPDAGVPPIRARSFVASKTLGTKAGRRRGSRSGRRGATPKS